MPMFKVAYLPATDETKSVIKNGKSLGLDEVMIITHRCLGRVSGVGIYSYGLDNSWYKPKDFCVKDYDTHFIRSGWGSGSKSTFKNEFIIDVEADSVKCLIDILIKEMKD